MIQIQDILMARAKYDELPVELKKNLKRLHEAIHQLELVCPIALKLTSGYRPAALNAAVGGAPKSAHSICLAVDFACNGQLWAWCLQNLEQLQALGLYLEDKRWTPTWVHMQLRRPNSGKRIFVPSSAAPSAPQAWNGQYDRRFDS